MGGGVVMGMDDWLCSFLLWRTAQWIIINSAVKQGNALGPPQCVQPSKQQACLIVWRLRMLVPVLFSVAPDMSSMWQRALFWSVLVNQGWTTHISYIGDGPSKKKALAAQYSEEQ